MVTAFGRVAVAARGEDAAAAQVVQPAVDDAVADDARPAFAGPAGQGVAGAFNRGERVFLGAGGVVLAGLGDVHGTVTPAWREFNGLTNRHAMT
ncbi:hypothetical protein [Nonomuraea fuscirosea]|uniref:hypothetical protein n=1 Tax=Nonomuraea fuscirosea TaxID=1291556 RepID=UPI0011B2677D|nr:hypothetical protein [Nonomuraea fuscirosea]